ncbi:MAG: SDR family oxidoreductase [Acidobacteriota bacterium]|nr:SDR family oxidoreductase [Acidobacteriota bacterium]
MQIKLKPINEQVVVIFGASSGIGRQAALDFAERGAKVVVAARSEDGLKSLVEEIETKGGEAYYLIADAADFSQVKTVADSTFEKYGRLDTWVHSAGAFLFAKVEQTDADEYKRLIEVNLLGQIYGAKAALPYLKKSGGALIHISSVEAWRTVPFQSAYGASKHGINGFVQALRSELAHDKVPVSVSQILPAAINTPIYDKGRNKTPFKPRPVPPIYHPQIVSDAILYAAENPVTDLVAGGAGVGVVLAERFSPRLAEWMTGLIGFVGQKSDEKIDGEYAGSLFETVAGFDTVEGRFNDEQLKSDPITWLSTHPTEKNILLTVGGIVGGFLAWRLVKSSENNDEGITKNQR